MSDRYYNAFIINYLNLFKEMLILKLQFILFNYCNKLLCSSKKITPKYGNIV